MAEAVSKNLNRFIEYTAKAPWKLWIKPFRVAPAVYYVGNEWVGVYLIDAGNELILLDSGLFENVYLTLEAIRELGYDPKNIKHIMLSHCHCDHVGGVRAIQELSQAKIWMSQIDTEFKNHPANTEMDDTFYIPPYDINHYYDDSKPMQFGTITIQTCLTPGHTPGTTSFLISDLDEDGNILTAAMHGGVGPITMTNEFLEKYKLSQALRKEFVSGCECLKRLHVDIALPSHPAHGNLFKRCSGDPKDYRSFIDETLWNEFLDTRIAFIKDLEK